LLEPDGRLAVLVVLLLARFQEQLGALLASALLLARSQPAEELQALAAGMAVLVVQALELQGQGLPALALALPVRLVLQRLGWPRVLLQALVVCSQGGIGRQWAGRQHSMLRCQSRTAVLRLSAALLPLRACLLQQAVRALV
jgi:hypothetical protein